MWEKLRFQYKNSGDLDQNIRWRWNGNKPSPMYLHIYTLTLGSLGRECQHIGGEDFPNQCCIIWRNIMKISNASIYHILVKVTPRIPLIHGSVPDSKFHGANMGPIWGRQDPGGSHVGPMNFAFWDVYQFNKCDTKDLILKTLLNPFWFSGIL